VKTLAPPRSLKSFLQPYDRDIRELALRVREFVIERLEPAHESIYDAYNAVAMAYGPTERSRRRSATSPCMPNM
jgi:hypothetical protein